MNQEQTNIALSLALGDVQFIANVLSELPTKSGAFPLLQNIVQQTNAQQKQEVQTND